jgi:FMN phosphatase YigB (HAD superfamily)
MISKKIIEEFEKINQNIEFFPWVLEKMVELSKWYKLFLTTSSPTYVAENALKSWWIFELFEIIYWSEQIAKSEIHLEYFQEYSSDENFYRKALYIWDWNNDRVFAQRKNIDFIHIWNDKKDKFEINSVCEIDEILKLFNN